nr:MAG TPA: hypothetical protein [Caudoviricetes sp.]
MRIASPAARSLSKPVHPRIDHHYSSFSDF